MKRIGMMLALSAAFAVAPRGATVAVDPSQLASAIRRTLPVREAARQLGISASTYHRLTRAWAARLGDGWASDRPPATHAPSVSETLSADAV